MFLIDTDVAIYLRDAEPEITRRVIARDDQVAIGLFTLIELTNGSYADPLLMERRQAALTKLLQNTRILPADKEVVDSYSAILADAGFARARVFDRLIAATAIVNDLALITINGPDFRDIPGLKVEVWPAPGQ